MNPGKKTSTEKLDIRVVEMLVCPLTKTRLVLNKDRSELISRGARVAFPIRKGVPLLCLGEARTLDEKELDGLR
ncbi:MAG TPA: Trm112 family protein [Devosia sp.]|nr:Trm112 family protein [Devosia sp.]